MKFEFVKISNGNMKVGAIPNMSLTPGTSCSREACKTCHVNGCYAMKAYKQYPATRAAWDSNTENALFNLEGMESNLDAYFSRVNAPRFFRVHVGGDFITREYAEMWARIAEKHHGTKFLAFTKQFDNVRGVNFPENFALILSAWEGIEIPEDLKAMYPVAYCVDTFDAAPADAMPCPGHCDTCGACWFLRATGKNVAFEKH